MGSSVYRDACGLPQLQTRFYNFVRANFKLFNDHTTHEVTTGGIETLLRKRGGKFFGIDVAVGGRLIATLVRMRYT